MILLENEYISASFDPKGAELKSLINKNTKLNYVWKGDPAFWGKSSPVLFPVVGALKDNSYWYQDKRYEMSRHGFARDQVFNVQRMGEEELLFTLKDSPESLEIYPFEFKLGLRYRLEKNRLVCTYEVHNPGTGPLLFSIGGHPAFAVPLQKNESYEQYFLQFEKDSQLTSYKIEQNLISDHTDELSLNDGKLALQHALFYEDALVFKTLQSEQISIKNTETVHGLHFTFEGFPFFGIWAAKDADFVCLEPWCGIADGIHHDQQLENKEGIVRLIPGESWERSWKVETF